MLLLIISLVCCVISTTNGHGRMIDPPARASMWRCGYNTPPDYDDHGRNCGGFNNQHAVNNGECGICGDPAQGSRPHEAPGGKYATGKIVRYYKWGSVITVWVQVVANHFGYFEFRLCKNNDVTEDKGQECFDEHILTLAGTTETKWHIPRDMTWTCDLKIDVQLPKRLKCDQCILQWRYKAGNSWGCSSGGGCCVGCGAQEEFYACSDIAILNNRKYRNFINTGRGDERFCTEQEEVAPIDTMCHGIGYWVGSPAMDVWCTWNCPAGNCPPSMCECDP